MNNNVHLIGLTGGIASGKSLVSSHLSRRGVPILDADLFAREVVAPGTKGLQEVVDTFGPAILFPNGTLDRAALAQRIFAEPNERNRLEALVHPRIALRVDEETLRLASQGEPLAVYAAALLVENGLADRFRPLVLVTAPPALQQARLALRDTLTQEEVDTRLRAQLSLAEKIQYADYVIPNDGDLPTLFAATDAVWDAVCQERGIHSFRYSLSSIA